MGKNGCLCMGFVFVVLSLSQVSQVVVCNLDPCKEIPATDNDVLQFILNFQFLEAEYYLNAADGRGLDSIDPALASGGPPPFGPQRANLDPITRRIIEEFGYQEIGQIRAIISKIVGRPIQRPLLNLSKENFASGVEAALGRPLFPPFDPYANPTNYLLSVNVITYNGLVGLVQAASRVIASAKRELVVKLLAIQAGQNAIVRGLLYQRANQLVVPYNITVAEFTNRTSTLGNRLGKCGLKDEGLEVPRSLGAENRTESNILAADVNSLAYLRTTKEILRVAYRTGDEGVPGGFFPKGANGRIAQQLIPRRN